MSKKKAFLIHLAASLFVFSVLLMLIIYVWYPAPYFDVDYRMKWIGMIAFVDIVIGPGLTLLVYRADKPTVKFDMSVIIVLQLTALSWGVWNAWSGHPKANVFYDGQLYCLNRSEIKEAGIDEKQVPEVMTDQIMLILPYPETPDLKKEYLEREDKSKPMVFSLGHLYKVASSEMTAQLGERQPDIMSVVNSSETNKNQWKQFISHYEVINPDWRYYQFHCFEDDRVAVLDRKNNKIEAIINMKLPLYWAFN